VDTAVGVWAKAGAPPACEALVLLSGVPPSSAPSVADGAALGAGSTQFSASLGRLLAKGKLAFYFCFFLIIKTCHCQCQGFQRLWDLGSVNGISKKDGEDKRHLWRQD